MTATMVAPRSPVASRTTMLALPVAAFLVVTAETLPVGLLGDIARDLDARPTSVGMLVGWYALVAAVAPVPIVRWTARYDRRTVLSVTLAVFALANLAAALAPNLAALFAARAVAAVTHGGFFAIAAPVLVRLAPPDRRGRAAGSLAVGAISALVMG
ncbi:MAG: MFS transporter, partial [Actinomycetota bacterium]|nr:MFS transporter [Actinomycetota bacterium]